MEDFADRYGAVGLFVVLALEGIIGVGLVVPGLTVLIAGGLLVATGVLPAWQALPAAWGGVLCGDTIGYCLGRWGARLHAVDRTIRRADRHVDLSSRRWWWAFFHFPVVTRSTVPLVLGAAHYPWRQWLLLSVTASALFVLAFGGIGLIAGLVSGGRGAGQHLGTVVQAVALAGLLAGLTALGVRGVLRRSTGAKGSEEAERTMKDEGSLD